jgi:type VI secretion system protein
MISERTLLERLRDPRSVETRSTELDYTSLVNSIIANLRHMLNTRQGGVPIQADYGVPEYGTLAYGMPTGLMEFQQSIKNTIEKYEPRLRHVRVKLRPPEENQSHLIFDVTAQLNIKNEEAVLRFETSIDSTGQVKIKD